MTVQIIEIIDRSDQGITRPFICRGNDDEIYFVKGRDAGRRSLICEWIAGSLGIKLGLPIAPFCVVEVPESLIALGSRDDLGELGHGLAFGSIRQKIVELTIAHIDLVPTGVQRDVLAFDWWIRNGDRTLSESGGNPNLFWNVVTNGLVVLDHNQAFDDGFSPLEFANLHVFRAHCRDLFEDWVTRDLYATRFIAAMASWPEICNTVPPEWWFLDAELTLPVDFDPDAIRRHLLDCRSDAFWKLK